MERRVQYYNRDNLDVTLPEDIGVELNERDLDAGGVLLVSTELVAGERADEIERAIHSVMQDENEQDTEE